MDPPRSCRAQETSTKSRSTQRGREPGLRAPQLGCAEALAVPERHHGPVLLLCTAHSKQETRGQHQPS